VAQLLGEAPDVTDLRLTRDGGDAVLAQLEAIDLAERVATVPADHLLSRFHATGLSPADLLWSVVPVLPADLRPTVGLGGDRFGTSDLTERYRAIIESDLALRGLLDLGAPGRLVEPERARLLRSVHALFDDDQTVNPRVERPLASMRSMLASHVRPNELRRVDYAAWLVTVVDPALQGTAAVMSEDALSELLLPRLYGLLEERGVVTSIKAAKVMLETDLERRRALTAELAPSLPWLVMHADAARAPTVVAVTPTPGREPNLRLSPELARTLDAQTGDLLAVHLPVCDEALSEARWLARFPTGRFRAHQVSSAGFAALAEQTLTSWDPLVDAALAGASDDGSSLESGLLVGGFDLVRFPRPSENVW
jgi:DNA-directed RNA polymerase beta' subunit